MSTVNDTDLLLVNRGGQSYNVKIEDMSTVEDTDLLLINRGGQSFKVEAKDLPGGGEVITAPEIGNVVLAQQAGDRFDNAVFGNTISYVNQGSTNNTISMGVEVVGNLQQKGKTSPIGSTGSTSLGAAIAGDTILADVSPTDLTTQMAAAGVTGIQGISLLSTASACAYITFINVDGYSLVGLRSPNWEFINGGEPIDSTAGDYESWFNAEAGYIQGKYNNGQYWARFPLTSWNSSFTIQGDQYNNNLKG